MYLHLGRDTVVNTDDIIAMMDLESSSISKYSKEFLKIVEEEIDEISHWLSIIIDAEILSKSRIEPLYSESTELC